VTGEPLTPSSRSSASRLRRSWVDQIDLQLFVRSEMNAQLAHRHDQAGDWLDSSSCQLARRTGRGTASQISVSLRVSSSRFPHGVGDLSSVGEMARASRRASSTDLIHGRADRRGLCALSDTTTPKEELPAKQLIHKAQYRMSSGIINGGPVGFQGRFTAQNIAGLAIASFVGHSDRDAFAATKNGQGQLVDMGCTRAEKEKNPPPLHSYYHVVSEH